MFIISGTRKFKKSMGSMSRKVICSTCEKEEEFEVVRVISWFTFFFVPLFPYSFKYYLLCPNCEMGYKINKQKAKEILADYSTNNTEIIKRKADLINNLERTMIIEDFNEQYKLSKGRIMKKERNTELKIGGIGICLFSILVFLFINSKDGWNELAIGFCILVISVLIISAPFRLIILHINYKRCPENIRCQWDHLWIGEQHYSFSDLKILEITSPKIESHSIYPVQHYIYVISNSRKDIYWLGSTASLSAQEYYKLCNTIEKMFLQYPEKFKYTNKGSLMSK